MALYFFDVHDGFHVVDEKGRQFADLESAKAEAMRVASAFASAPSMLADNGGAIIVAIRDGSNNIVMNVRLVFSVEAI